MNHPLQRSVHAGAQKAISYGFSSVKWAARKSKFHLSFLGSATASTRVNCIALRSIILVLLGITSLGALTGCQTAPPQPKTQEFIGWVFKVHLDSSHGGPGLIRIHLVRAEGVRKAPGTSRVERCIPFPADDLQGEVPVAMVYLGDLLATNTFISNTRTNAEAAHRRDLDIDFAFECEDRIIPNSSFVRAIETIAALPFDLLFRPEIEAEYAYEFTATITAVVVDEAGQKRRLIGTHRATSAETYTRKAQALRINAAKQAVDNLVATMASDRSFF